MMKRAMRERELAGDTRAGSYARAMARREQRAFMRRNPQWLLGAWLVLMTPTLVAWWFIPSELLRGALLGADLATATALVWSWVVQSTGTAPTMMGDLAEQWTAQTLRKLGKSWRLVNHFMLGQGDMDHVAIGPAGIVVVETKWTAKSWDSPDGVERQRRAVAQVQRSARQLSLWTELKATGLPVRPVVVLWGGQTYAWPEDERVRRIDGTHVVLGEALVPWLESLKPAVAQDEMLTRHVWTVLDTHSRRRDNAGVAVIVPPSVMSLLGRLASIVLSLIAGFLIVAYTLEWTGSYGWTIAMGAAVFAGATIAGRRWGVIRREAWAFEFGSALPTMLLAAELVIRRLN
jgi:hypothetical protein